MLLFLLLLLLLAAAVVATRKLSKVQANAFFFLPVCVCVCVILVVIAVVAHYVAFALQMLFCAFCCCRCCRRRRWQQQQQQQRRQQQQQQQWRRAQGFAAVVEPFISLLWQPKCVAVCMCACEYGCDSICVLWVTECVCVQAAFAFCCLYF